MKKYYLALVLWSCTMVAQSQITLEHIYPYNNVSRVLIPGIGERYYALTSDSNTGTGTIRWFNGNHQLIDSTVFNMPSGITNVSLVHLSADFFDDDPGIECMIRWINATFNPINRVLDDDGMILSEDYNGLPSFFTTGNGKKMQIGHKIYHIPGFFLEVELQGSTGGNILIENEGRKFWYLQFFEGNIVLLNEDYSPYLTFPAVVDIPTGCPYNIAFYGKYQVNGDDNIEWSYNYRCPGGIVLRHFSNADSLFEYNESVSGSAFATTLTPLMHPGLDGAKSFIYHSSGGSTDSIQVYDIVSGVKEHVFTGRWNYSTSDQSGIKYYQSPVEAAATTVSVLNPDYGAWASFTKYEGLSLDVHGVSESIFDNDENTKEIFGRYLIGSVFRHSIWRSNGTILTEIDNNMNSSLISRLEGLPNKLIFLSPSVSVPPITETHIYSLPSSTPVSTTEKQTLKPLSFTVFPNPFSGAIRVDFSNIEGQVESIEVYDLTGRNMYRQVISQYRQVWELADAVSWPQGIYFVQIRSGQQVGVQKVVRQ
ncbi:MAG: T9SS type A sorting domain-containing protein [Saprospiraceae bacterium]|nr:T9SS type A sorting domain-containing protein [Saprospiraceae bacterium]